MDQEDTAADHIVTGSLDFLSSDLEFPALPENEDSPVIDGDSPTTDNDLLAHDTKQNTSEDTPQTSSEASKEPLLCKRELRSTRNIKRPAPTTWLDLDTTGDFDPLEEARKLKPRKKRTRPPHREFPNWSSDGVVNEPSTGLRPQEQATPILCISFSSDSARATFSELSAKFQREVKPARDDFSEGYQLRKRKGTCDGSSSEHFSLQTTGVRVIASEQLGDLQNHPVARGCYDCLAVGTRCSLLDNEHSWPCEECKANDTDCHLVKEPKLKLACTHCQYLGKREKWLVCSFDYEEDPANHHGRCKQCRKDGHRNCVAGHRPGTIPTRIRIGADGRPYTNQPSAAPKAPQKITCRKCLESRRTCSLASRSAQSDGDVCTACDMSGDICEPLGPRAPKKQSSRPNRTSRIASHGKLAVFDEDPEPTTTNRPSSSPLFVEQTHDAESKEPALDEEVITISSSSPPAEDLSEPEGGTTITITTKLSHPVSFEHHPTALSTCSFCSSPPYPIIGLEQRTVEVIAWHDGSGYEELSGGHRSEGVKSTHVCSACMMARMQVMACEDHALRPVRTLRNSILHRERELGAAVERLSNGNVVIDRWCSVCCNLADWECCAGQVGQPGIEGCGLALCEACVADLERSDGSLEMMLRGLRDEATVRRPIGLRADYELLKMEGFLMNFVASEQS